MKHLVYHGPGALAFEESPVPVIAPDEVLIRTKVVGICGSDLHAFLHATPRRTPPVVMGHEAAGIVEKTGTDVRGLRAGDRVVPHPLTHCGACDWCAAGQTQLCPARTVLGVNTPGCYAEFFKVKARVVRRIPDSLPFEIAALTEPFSVGLHAVKTALAADGANEGASMRPGSIAPRKPGDALIIGAGTVGLMTLINAVRHGLRRVFVEDLSPERLELARRFGGIVEGGRGGLPPVDIVFDAVGIEPTFQQAVRRARTGGRIVLLGMSQPFVSLDLLAVVTRELRLCGSYTFDSLDIDQAIQELDPDLKPLIGLVRPFEEAVSVFETLAACEGRIVKAMLTF